MRREQVVAVRQGPPIVNNVVFHRLHLLTIRRRMVGPGATAVRLHEVKAFTRHEEEAAKVNRLTLLLSVDTVGADTQAHRNTYEHRDSFHLRLSSTRTQSCGNGSLSGLYESRRMILFLPKSFHPGP